MFKRNSLDKVAQSLLTALKTSGDKRLAPLCAEYSVASKLLQKGHDPQVLQKRRGPDIYLKDIEKYIEVKSGHSDLSDWGCGASFGKGNSIKNREFDYCVFVVFSKLKPSEFLVFTVEELREVAENPRPKPYTVFPNNPCVLFRSSSLEEYKENLDEHTLGIELKLHRYPEQFQDRWDKIE